MLLTCPVIPPADLALQERVILGANLSWLLCKDICIAGKTSLQIDLRVSTDSGNINGQAGELFDQAKIRSPLADTDWRFKAVLLGSIVRLDLIPPTRMDGENVSEISFLPYFPDVIAQGQPQTFLKTGAHYVLHIPLPANRRQDPKSLQGILTGEAIWHSSIPAESVYLDIPVN